MTIYEKIFKLLLDEIDALREENNSLKSDTHGIRPHNLRYNVYQAESRSNLVASFEFLLDAQEYADKKKYHVFVVNRSPDGSTIFTKLDYRTE